MQGGNINTIYFLFPFLHKYVILFSSRAERILQDSSACFFIISMPAYSGADFAGA